MPLPQQPATPPASPESIVVTDENFASLLLESARQHAEGETTVVTKKKPCGCKDKMKKDPKTR